MSYLTEQELLSLDLSNLKRDAPFAITGVSQTQFSVARHYGGCKYNGYHYTYIPHWDELVRDDVVKFIKKLRKVKPFPTKETFPKQIARSVPWICADCALKSGAETIEGHIATYHIDICGVCGGKKSVTEPRDFSWCTTPT